MILSGHSVVSPNPRFCRMRPAAVGFELEVDEQIFGTLHVIARIFGMVHARFFGSVLTNFWAAEAHGPSLKQVPGLG